LKSKQTPIETINTENALIDFCRAIRTSDFIAVDTEFMREKTYFPQLCLIQIATTEQIACIDPLAIEDMDPLYEILFDTNILKVLHASGQDLELIYHLTNRLPEPVFDTQIAAAMLGEGEQISYAAFIKSMLDIDLDKSQTRTDWSKRPLSAAQVNYAADDVRHLVTAYQKQLEILTEKGRLEWLASDFKQLSNPEQFTQTDEALLKRVKGTQRLKPKQLAIILGLARWREQTAKDKNKPRKWILSDNVMIDLAKRPPENLAELSDFRGLSPGQIKHSGKQLLDAIKAARQLPPDQWPNQTRRKKLDASQAIVADAVMVLLRVIGDEHNIAPGSLSSRTQIEKLIAGEKNIPLLQGWRHKLAGQSVEKFLEGKSKLSVKSDKLFFSEK